MLTEVSLFSEQQLSTELRSLPSTTDGCWT